MLQLLSLLEDWTFYVNAVVPVDGVFNDFAKAFESVSHLKLAAKLSSFGFQGKLLD